LEDRRMKRLSVLVLPLVALTLAACGSSSSSSSSSSTTSSSAAPATSASTPASTGAGGPAVAVKMQNITFSPTAVHAKVGDTVTWTNMDQVSHNVTYVSGPNFASSQTFANGGTFKLKLTKAGTISYRCTIHPGMTGTIVVAP
jgi:plastocyanin